MKIAVIGSRDFYSLLEVFNFLDSNVDTKKDSLISGGARGVDEVAETFARLRNLQIEIVRPENPAIKKDYILRNFKIVKKADKIFAFWDGKSRGTKSVIDFARKNNKDLIVIT